MCFGRKPAPPPPPPAPVPPPSAPPTQASGAVKAARKAEKKAAANLQGRKSTILTGPRGDLSVADVQKKTLLGN
jgi:pyruvate/2-oxoglutarate dehydrogenase complex dihydrolipoamide acyltransferase (E2) component